MHDVIFGVDPKKTALAGVVIREDGFRVYTRTMPDDLTLCCHKAFLWMRRVVLEEMKLNPLATVHVYLEKALVGPGRNATIVQAYVQGGLIAGAVDAGAIVHQVNQARWKSQIVGVGNATKSLVARHVKLQWPELFAQVQALPKLHAQDVLDAGCIAWYGDNEQKTLSKRRGRGRR